MGPEGWAGRSPPSLCHHVTSSAGLEGAEGPSAVFPTIPRLPDGFAGLGFDSSEGIACISLSHLSSSSSHHAGAWKLMAFEGPVGALVETRGSPLGQELQRRPQTGCGLQRVQRKPGCPMQHPAPKPNEAETSVPVRPSGSSASAKMPLLVLFPQNLSIPETLQRCLCQV